VTHTLPTRARSRALRVSLALAILLACGTLGCERAAAAVSAASWDSAQQRQVVADGLMSESAGSFSGAGQLFGAQANAAMAALVPMLPSTSVKPTEPGEPGSGEESSVPTPTSVPVPPPAPVAHTAQNPVTVAAFDRMIVEELGLASVAAHVQQTADAVGLDPPSYFGTEVVARFLELDYEHPVGAQRLDLFPDQPITRAAAAWSLAKVIGVTTWDVSDAREALTAFELPQMTAAQRQALRIAVSRIGYPYVWGGTTDKAALLHLMKLGGCGDLTAVFAR
jgi:hypothetical protein